MTGPPATPDPARLGSFLATDPVLARVRETGLADRVYLVGGAIRDALCGFPVDDIDLVVEGDPEPLVAMLDPEARTHPRFGTAELRVGGAAVDIARARTETYPRPGALPEVSFASLEDDLHRRDFTVNAVAVPLLSTGPTRLIDPWNGVGDIRAGLLRILHRDSFRDDPTRALRAARYAARFGWGLEPDTARLLAATDLATVSDDRRRHELDLIAAEPNGLEGLRLLGRWGLLEVDETGLELAGRALGLLAGPPWQGSVPEPEVRLASLDLPRAEIERLQPEPASPYDGDRVAAAHSAVELLLARAAGATWLDRWQRSWRHRQLAVAGSDLVAAGIPEGPAVGKGLEAARRAMLNDDVSDRDGQLEVAIRAADR